MLKIVKAIISKYVIYTYTCTHCNTDNVICEKRIGNTRTWGRCINCSKSLNTKYEIADIERVRINYHIGAY